ncbi:MAG: hypothetical protein OSA45_01605 [Halioglobus sp.]|nr:hypothetical protein [Halioglobus sp.]
MLSESSYLTAIYVYVGSACIILLYLGWWLGRHWRPAWVVLVVLLTAVLLLTPAYPRAGVDTMAPAVIVAAFQILTQDIDSAQHALKPLVFFSEVAVVIALLLRLLVFRRPRKVTASTAKRPVQS